MNSSWKFKDRDRIGILELDCPGTPVNVLNADNLSELQSHINAIAEKKDLQALLFTSAKKRIFIAGADINIIQGIDSEQKAFTLAEEGKALLRKIEDLAIPTVCVINGACLGGGYELALACQARVASFSDDVKIGLPEVNLGILPGFGGSIRMPRLLGLLNSLPLILAGKILGAKEAHKKGLVDALFPAGVLLESAAEYARNLGSAKRPAKKSPFMKQLLEDTPFGRGWVLSQARKNILKKTRGAYPAPLEILRLIGKTYGKKSARVYRQESEGFAKLATTEVSKNLIKLFFISERYKKREWTAQKTEAAPVRKCGVVGAGVMGGGIAQRVSSKEIPVRVKDINEKAAAGALAEASRIYRGAVKRKRLRPAEAEFRMGLISAGLTNEGFRNCDMIIEAVVEDIGIKKKIFAELDALALPDAVLASNTSSLSVGEMASVCKNPGRVIGIHFFNPVDRMPLVEIIRAERTTDETVARAVQFARRLGKTAIVVKDAPGFLVNRILLPYLNEAAYLMETGVAPDRIDRAIERFGMPMGPLELVDQVGIDVCYKAAHVLEKGFGDRMKVSSLIDAAYGRKLLGKKGGKGFYIYEGRKKRVNPEMLPAARGAQDAVSDEDIVSRLIYVMINEAAHCLGDGVADEPATVDMGMIMGTGFPPFRAGLLHYADQVGSEQVARVLKQLQNEVSPLRFKTSPYLAELAASKKPFYR